MPSLLHHTPTNTHLFKTQKITAEKTSHCFTQNLLILSYKLSEPQTRLLLYLIVKADSRNYIKLDTVLIKKYIATQFTIKKDLCSNKKLWGSNSYNTVKSDIIFLINTHVLLQLKDKSPDYIINPVYCYPKIAYSLSGVATDFSVEWMNKIASNQLDNKTVRLMAMRYYIACQAKYNSVNKVKYGKEFMETARLKRLFKELSSFIATDETKATTGK